MVDLRLDVPGLDGFVARLSEFPDALSGDIEAAGREGTQLVEDAARQGAARRTGRLASSIGSEVTALGAEFRGLVSTAVDYAPFVEDGTRPHQILPQARQALFWPGAAHPVRSVQHPGTRAQPFMRPALRTNVARIMGLLRQGVIAAYRRLRG